MWTYEEMLCITEKIVCHQEDFKIIQQYLTHLDKEDKELCEMICDVVRYNMRIRKRIRELVKENGELDERKLNRLFPVETIQKKLNGNHNKKN